MKLLAIDGNSILNRAFYAIRGLTNKNGISTNAIVGFMNIYLKEMEVLKPDAVVVAFDLRAPTFRHKKVETYKANRKGMPEELAQQLPYIKKIIEYMGAVVLEREGYEADDILGTLSRICTEKGEDCFVLSGDRDNLQLINEKVNVRLATNKETLLYNKEKFLEDYGFEPENLIDLKALMGDSSDNIKGVAGVGEKTATTLIKEWKTIENMYENIDEVKASKAVITKLQLGKNDAQESKWLATICKEVPIEDDLNLYIIKEKQISLLQEILSELEMNKLIEKLNLKAIVLEDPKETKEGPLETTKAKKFNYFELGKTPSDFFKNEKDVDYILVENKLYMVENENIYFTEKREYILDFLNSDIKKRTYLAKESYKYAFENNVELKNLIFDVEIAGYLLNPSSTEYNIKNLSEEYNLHYYEDDYENQDIKNISALCDKLNDEIEKLNMSELFNNIELPLTEVLASMELSGIKIDDKGIEDFGKKLVLNIEELITEIHKLAGKEFNISSPKQLAEVLFVDLGLKGTKKTKTGYSTNVEVLEALKDKHPIINLILQYRQITKLNSTYVEGLLKTVAEDGRIHTCFRQTETRTGRISSIEPNLQNIPVRTELGRNMRKFFIAESGKILVDADYNQIELRIMAHVSDDENMKNAFLNDMDIHTVTASQVFNLPLNMVTSSMRSAAKAVNFGIIYGIGAFSLSKDINVTVSEADRYIKNYLHNFSKVEAFMKNTIDTAIENGYVTTFLGRRRYIPELKSSNKIVQAAGKRIAMNTPVQGAAADVIKIAMIKVYRRLKEENLNANLILQIHDELIIESEIKDAEQASIILKEEMQNACLLNIPLTVDVNKGDSWYNAKG